MIRLVLNTLITLIVCLNLSSCCSWCKKDPCIIKVEIVNAYTKCPTPDKPTFSVIPPEGHIGSKVDLDILTDNLLKTLTYNDRLINTINCYENQTKMPEDRK